jgi:hypothetical protein
MMSCWLWPVAQMRNNPLLRRINMTLHHTRILLTPHVTPRWVVKVLQRLFAGRERPRETTMKKMAKC